MQMGKTPSCTPSQNESGNLRGMNYADVALIFWTDHAENQHKHPCKLSEYRGHYLSKFGCNYWTWICHLCIHLIVSCCSSYLTMAMIYQQFPTWIHDIFTVNFLKYIKRGISVFHLSHSPRISSSPKGTLHLLICSCLLRLWYIILSLKVTPQGY